MPRSATGVPALLPTPEGAIPYVLHRSAKRRSIGLRITAGALHITIPQRFSAQDLPGLLAPKLNWIRQKLADPANQTMPRTLREGDQVPWLDYPVTLAWAPAGRSKLAGGILLLACPSPDDVPAALARYMQAQARTLFAERVALWAGRMALQPARIALSGARGRWGSCTSHGNLRLNWRLVQAPLAVIDSVVIHELAHLQEMNHSPRFWEIVHRHCPQYAVHDRWLKQYGRQLFAW